MEPEITFLFVALPCVGAVIGFVSGAITVYSLILVRGYRSYARRKAEHDKVMEKLNEQVKKTNEEITKTFVAFPPKEPSA